MILKCIAIDDEILALNKIKRFISKIDFVDLKNCFDNAKDAIDYLTGNKIDLILLDIEMPEITGFDLLNKLEYKPYVILTTAFDQYALKSYDFDVDDYLLKPIQFDRFLKAIEKVYTKIKKDKKLEIEFNEDTKDSTHIFIKSSGKLLKINTDDIQFIEGMKDYLAINLKDKRILTLMSFKDFLKKLPQGEFIRIHKSYIVAKTKIDEMGTNELTINKQKLPISKTYKKELQILKDKLS